MDSIHREFVHLLIFVIIVIVHTITVQTFGRVGQIGRLVRSSPTWIMLNAKAITYLFDNCTCTIADASGLLSRDVALRCVVS